MKLSLVVTTAGKAEGQQIPIKLAQFVIGRDPQCNLRPASALISKRHCAILVKSGLVFVRDFDSTNGTFVNEQQIQGEVPLKNSDLLRVGPLTFKVSLEQTPSVSKPTPPPKPAGNQDDEAAAAMLMGLHDDAETSEASDSSVPGGSTVFDMPNPIAGSTPPDDEPAAEKKPEVKKPDAKANAASASKAAESLLARYSRRQR